MTLISKSAPIDIDVLVINWHITDKCNYRCKYCFASWQADETGGEVWRSEEKTKRLLEELWLAFDPDNVSNPLRSKLRWRSVRLSLAGGEATLLQERLIDITQHAKKLGFSVSLITNGSLLTEPYLTAIIPGLSMLGLSVDSTSPQTNAAIGRSNRRGPPLTTQNFADITKWARTVNPGLTIKLNTVVNKVNAHENMSGLLNAVEADRWKVMRVLPIKSDHQTISDLTFREFVERHGAYSSIMSVENNTDMTQSYIMVDPYGRFFQNSRHGGRYSYSDAIKSVGPIAAFSQVPFDSEKFTGRYG